jgi:hypothetical protein
MGMVRHTRVKLRIDELTRMGTPYHPALMRVADRLGEVIDNLN